MAAVRLSRELANQVETKAALSNFAKTLSTEMIKRGIRVNTVNPGLIRTPDWENTARDLAGDKWEGYLQEVADEHADIKRFGTVEERADFCVFVRSPRASYCAGSAYHVDCGMLKTT